jgi:hypothetical protein
MRKFDPRYAESRSSGPFAFVNLPEALEAPGASTGSAQPTQPRAWDGTMAPGRWRQTLTKSLSVPARLRHNKVRLRVLETPVGSNKVCEADVFVSSKIPEPKADAQYPLSDLVRIDLRS